MVGLCDEFYKVRGILLHKTISNFVMTYNDLPYVNQFNFKLDKFGE
jgi:hypothetical protein